MSDPKRDEAADEPQAMPINWDTEPTPAYTNGVQVTHNPAEFALLFTEMNAFVGRNAPGNEPGKERARVVGSLRMSPDTYFQMLNVLCSNWNRYATRFIDSRMRQPRFKLFDAGELQLEHAPKTGDIQEGTD